MKKKIKGKHVVIALIVLCALSVIVTSDVMMYKKERQLLGGLNVPSSAVYLLEVDTHSGMTGDGDYFAKIQLPKEDAEKLMEKAIEKGNWTKLPIDINLPIRKETDYEDGKKLRIPDDIKRGIYFFEDRYAKMHDGKEMMEEEPYYSGNYIISVLDSENNILYIYKYDS